MHPYCCVLQTVKVHWELKLVVESTSSSNKKIVGKLWSSKLSYIYKIYWKITIRQTELCVQKVVLLSVYHELNLDVQSHWKSLHWKSEYFKEGCSSRVRTCCQLVRRSVFWFPVHPVCTSKCLWTRYWISNCSPLVCKCVCMSLWMRVYEFVMRLVLCWEAFYQ